MKSEKGSLTIEATVALTAFMFLVFTVLSFASIYKAQSIVSHATLQTSQSLAVESYYRKIASGGKSAESLSKLIKFAEMYKFNGISDLDDWYAPFEESEKEYKKSVKKAFIYAVSDDKQKADKILKEAGIEDGIAGLSFQQSCVDDGNIIVNVKYKVNLPFSFFGKKTISMSKSAMTKAFS